MKTLFNTVLRKATELTRAQNVMEATRFIQRALVRHAASPDTEPSHVKPAEALQKESRDGSFGAMDGDFAASVKRSLEGALESLRRADLPGSRLEPVPLAPLGRARKVPVPEGAAYLARSYSCAAGSREYKVYVPRRTKERERPLLVLLHGCTQNPDDFALGTKMNGLAEEHGFIAAYPGQSVSANHSGCWNWFNRKDQLRDTGEPSIIAGITRSLMAEFGIHPKRVYVAGLSAGGAMAAVMSATYPELYAAAGIHSGLAYGAASDVASAFAVMKGTPVAAFGKHPPSKALGQTRTIVFQGMADKTVHPSNADAIVAVARAGLPGEWRETWQDGLAAGRAYKRLIVGRKGGIPELEYWAIADLAHAWSGGSPDGSYTDPQGPDASAEMLRFFLASREKDKAF